MSGVAIIGMACIFPGARDLESYWRNIVAGVDAISDVPSHRWDPVFYDPTSNAIDRLYCRRGGFIDEYAEFDALEFGVMPVEADGAESEQLLALQLASRALADAGYERRSFSRNTTGVIVGRGSYPSTRMTRVDQQVRGAEQLATCLRTCLPEIDEEKIKTIKAFYQARLGAYSAENAIGVTPNLGASRVANRLDLQGPAYTVDAACASALVAIDHACQQLASGACDMVLAGGVHLNHDATFWSVFSQLGAVSRRQQIRPFDRSADGLLLGEGVGFVMLQRLEDALRDDNRIYAVIRGTGVASDGRAATLMKPRVEGQLLALERAWAAARCAPDTLGLIEAHGTGTPIGDAAELTTLGRFFGRVSHGTKRAVLGSVKSMIGHTMPAAGIAGLIKTALALYHDTLPPTLHCEEPHPGLSDTRFRPIASAEQWDRHDTPRLAGVNAFGFGGINAHIVLEEHGHRKSTRVRSEQTDEHFIALAARNREGLLALLDDVARNGGRPTRTEARSGACRLAVFNPTPARIARARDIVSRGNGWRGREDVWFADNGLIARGGRIAFLFPGIDTSFKPRVEDVAERLKRSAPVIPPAGSLQRTSIAVIEVNRLLDKAVRQLGIHPEAIAGHSIGEWSGLIAAGVVSEEAVDPFVASLVPDSLVVPDVVFLAAGCSAARAMEAAEGLDIRITHDNCPHQLIVCGPIDSINTAAGRLRSHGVLCQILPFQSGFHSPFMREHLTPFREKSGYFEYSAPSVPLWSATTCAKYPLDPSAIDELIIEHLVKPVRFRELAESLYREGFRAFIQIGSGSLSGFVSDTFHDREHLAIAANVPTRSGLAQLRRVAAALFVEGLDEVMLDNHSAPASGSKPRRTPAKLALGLPLIELERVRSAERTPFVTFTSASESPLIAEFTANLQAIASAHEAIHEAWSPFRGRTQLSPRRSATKRLFSIDTLPVMDHCFFSQAADCRSLVERYPVVPMTTSLELMGDAVRELVPERTVVSFENVRSYRWLAVTEPVEATITAESDGFGAAVSIDGYIEAKVGLAEAFPRPPVSACLARLRDECPPPVKAERLYRDRWMFHGPAFQGIVGVNAIGSNGIRGTIRAGAAPGATLDNAGQLFGHWVQVRSDTNRFAVPTAVDEMHFFGPAPVEGTLVLCDVRIVMSDQMTIRADLELSVDGSVWCSIRGWEDRRFETDERLWPLVREPERHLLAAIRGDGSAVFCDRYGSANSRDYLSRRFLAESERRDYLAVGPKRQRRWLAGRIAAKDAARAWLWSRGYGPLFPAQILVSEDAGGRPHIAGPFQEDLRVSIANKDDIAIAIIGHGIDVDIDAETLARL